MIVTHKTRHTLRHLTMAKIKMYYITITSPTSSKGAWPSIEVIVERSRVTPACRSMPSLSLAELDSSLLELISEAEKLRQKAIYFFKTLFNDSSHSCQRNPCSRFPWKHQWPVVGSKRSGCRHGDNLSSFLQVGSGYDEARHVNFLKGFT